MAELADVSPERYAPLVAPVIERLTFAVLQHAIGHAGQLPQTVSPEALRMLGQLRTALMARPVSADGLAAVYRYRDAAQIEQDLQGLITAGLADRSGDGGVTATEGGRVVLGAMYDGLAAAASRLWAAQAARLTRLPGPFLPPQMPFCQPNWARVRHSRQLVPQPATFAMLSRPETVSSRVDGRVSGSGAGRGVRRVAGSRECCWTDEFVILGRS